MNVRNLENDNSQNYFDRDFPATSLNSNHNDLNNKKNMNENNIRSSQKNFDNFLNSQINNNKNDINKHSNSKNIINKATNNSNSSGFTGPNDINSLKYNIVLEKIKLNIENLFNIISLRVETNKYKAFLQIKDFMNSKRINLIKSEIVFDKFRNVMGSLFKIYLKYNKIKFSKYFYRWRDYTMFRKKYFSLKTELEKGLEKKYEKELKMIELKIKEKENENNEIKKSIQKNNEIEVGILKTINEFEEKENNYMKSIKKLEEEKKNIQEEIDFITSQNNKGSAILSKINYNILSASNINNPNNLSQQEMQQKIFSSNNNINSENNYNYENAVNGIINSKKEYLSKLEEKIKQLEIQIQILKDENSEKDQKIAAFMTEMSEILQSHEKNSIYFFIFNKIFFKICYNIVS